LIKARLKPNTPSNSRGRRPTLTHDPPKRKERFYHSPLSRLVLEWLRHRRKLDDIRMFRTRRTDGALWPLPSGQGVSFGTACLTTQAGITAALARHLVPQNAACVPLALSVAANRAPQSPCLWYAGRRLGTDKNKCPASRPLMTTPPRRTPTIGSQYDYASYDETSKTACNKNRRHRTIRKVI